MDAAYISALAGLAGAAIGGLTSLATTWVGQHTQVRTQQLEWDKTRRTTLYVQFIEEASKLYADALEHDETEAANLVGMYSMISRMRIISSQKIVKDAERVVRVIVDTYLAPNRTFRDLRELTLAAQDPKSGDTADPLRGFAEACREELRALGYR
jgi:hypothetical protein